MNVDVDGYLSAFNDGVNSEVDDVIEANLFVSIQDLNRPTDRRSVNDASRKNLVRLCSRKQNKIFFYLRLDGKPI